MFKQKTVGGNLRQKNQFVSGRYSGFICICRFVDSSLHLRSLYYEEFMKKLVVLVLVLFQFGYSFSQANILDELKMIAQSDESNQRAREDLLHRARTLGYSQEAEFNELAISYLIVLKDGLASIERQSRLGYYNLKEIGNLCEMIELLGTSRNRNEFNSVRELVQSINERFGHSTDVKSIYQKVMHLSVILSRQQPGVFEVVRQVPAPNDHFPSQVKTVTMDEVQKEISQAGQQSSDEPSASTKKAPANKIKKESEANVAPQGSSDYPPAFVDLMAEAKKKGKDYTRSLDIGYNTAIQMLENLVMVETPHVFLLGNAGSGKTTIVENLAHLLLQDKLPAYLKSYYQNKRILKLSIGVLNKTLQGDPEYLEKLDSFAKARGESVLLAIDEFHKLSPDLADDLKPFLSREMPNVRIIAISTPREAKNTFKQNEAFERRFTEVTALEPTTEEIVKYLKSEGLAKFENHYNVKFKLSDAELAFMTNRSQIVFPNQSRLQSINTLIDRLGFEVVKAGKKTVEKSDVVKKVEFATGIISDPEDHSRIEAFIKELAYNLNEELTGQENLVSEVANEIKTFLQQNERKNRNLLLVGKSGLGKTLIAKLLGRFFYKSSDRVLEIDGASFHDKHSSWRLFGVVNGYKDSELSAGILADFLDNAAKGKFGGVINVSEFEKMAPEIQKVFLDMIDTGSGKSFGDGVIRSVGNCIFVFSANGRADEIYPSHLQDMSDRELEDYLKAFNTRRLTQILVDDGKRPGGYPAELLGRMHLLGIVRPMTKAKATRHIEKVLKKFAKEMKLKHGIEVEVTERLKSSFQSVNYDYQTGYRALDIVLEKFLANLRTNMIDAEFSAKNAQVDLALNVSGADPANLKVTLSKPGKTKRSNPVVVEKLIKESTLAREYNSPDSKSLYQVSIHEAGHVLNIFEREAKLEFLGSQVVVDGNGVISLARTDTKNLGLKVSVKTEELVIARLMYFMGGRVAELQFKNLPPSSGWSIDQREISDLLNEFTRNLDLGYVEFNGEGQALLQPNQMKKVEDTKSRIYKLAWDRTQENLQKNQQLLRDVAFHLYRFRKITPEQLASIKDRAAKNTQVAQDSKAKVESTITDSSSSNMCRDRLSGKTSKEK